MVTLDPLVGESTVEPWTYRIQLPGDCARILSVSADDAEVEYEQVRSILHTQASEVDLRYVSNFANEDDDFTFPDDFAEALSNLLAAELAIPLMQAPDLRNIYLDMYAERLSQARFNGAVEQPQILRTASSWADAHDGWVATEIDPRLRGLSGI